MMFEAWIIGLRTPFLTHYFKFFPYFAHAFFIMSVVGLGYWIGKSRRFFVHLAATVMICGMVNIILKECFAITRPPQSLHLVKVMDMLSFPSGDAQLAAVLWGMLALYFKRTWFSFLAVFLVINIMLSRVYLGVHTLYDVVAGCAVGATLVIIYRSVWLKRWVSGLEQGQGYVWFWGISAALAGIFAGVAHNLNNPLFPVIIGSLVGIGFAWPSIVPALNEAEPSGPLWLKSLVLVISVLCVTMLSKLDYPARFIVSSSDFIVLLTKYIAVTWSMFALIPTIQKRIFAKVS